MRIIKFGGTSVGSSEAIEKVAYILTEIHPPSETLAIVVSAFSGVTNQLIDMANYASCGDSQYTQILENLIERHHEIIFASLQYEQCERLLNEEVNPVFEKLTAILKGIFLLRECTDRSMDLVMSFGEQLSAIILTEILSGYGLPTFYQMATNFIRTDRNFGNARILKKDTYDFTYDYFQNVSGIPVITGFIGCSDPGGEITTLGRGGSDYTAALLAAAAKADEILIYTDVDGMMTADPKKVPSAFTLQQVSYQEAMELSHFGAKVLYPPTIQPAVDAQIPIRICNTFFPEVPGTLICSETGQQPWLITGMSSVSNLSLINVQGSGMVGVAGIAGRLFQALAQMEINIILITQASSEHSITFAVHKGQELLVEAAINQEFDREMVDSLLDPISIQKDMAIIAIVGENMKQRPGVSARIFGALGNNGINIVATAQGSSELNISLVVSQVDEKKALNALHQEFFSADSKKLNLFLVGPGLIGKTLLGQIRDQMEFLKSNLNLEIRLVGIANSKQMMVEATGIDIENWESVLQKSGLPVNLEYFTQKVIAVNLPNSILADCTASEVFLPYYLTILQKSISLLTPNKLANSAAMEHYLHLKETVQKHNTHFCYETNVGAGLPVIQTLKNLIHSGDQIHKIEGILSGTLSFIFNRFQSGIPFWKIVKEAKELGYTEPDPRDDLNGTDMARKILILARETGVALELDDVEIESFLPNACLNAPSVDDFFEALKTEDDYFQKLAKLAENEGKKLKFICKMESGKASIKLEAIDGNHPFFNSSGTDNIIAFYTHRYQKRPLVVQGPGAGAEVTAAGLFGEIISLA